MTTKTGDPRTDRIVNSEDAKHLKSLQAPSRHERLAAHLLAAHSATPADLDDHAALVKLHAEIHAADATAPEANADITREPVATEPELPAHVMGPGTEATAAELEPEPTVVFFLDQEFQVHKPGCKDIAKGLKKSDYDSAMPLYVATRSEVVRELWDDQISESWDGPKDETPSDEWLSEHGYWGEVNFHPCTKGILVATAVAETNGTGPAKADQAKASKREAKQALARLVVAAIDSAMANLPAEVLAAFTPEQAARCTAQWIHHLPTGGIWPAQTLPKPDRSDWNGRTA